MKSTSLFSKIACLIGCCLFTSTLATGSGVATGDEAAIKAIVLQRVGATLAAFMTHDKGLYSELCLPEFYEITSAGTIKTLQDKLKELDDYVLADYHMEDVVMTVVSSMTTLIRYKIHAQYTYKGKPLAVEPMLASMVWVKRGDEWKAATAEEVKLAEGRQAMSFPSSN